MNYYTNKLQNSFKNDAFSWLRSVPTTNLICARTFTDDALDRRNDENEVGA